LYADARFLRVRAARVVDLVHPQHAVVVRGREPEIPRRPRVDETEVPDARHPEPGQLRHLVVREELQLAVKDRIEVRVVRRLAAEGVEERLRLVHVVPDRRHPVQIPIEMDAQRVDAVVDVAVVVMERVLAPVGRAAEVLGAVVRLVDFVRVIPVHRAIASVDVGRRCDADDHVVANGLDVRLL
jgi:hypothetical protein